MTSFKLLRQFLKMHFYYSLVMKNHWVWFILCDKGRIFLTFRYWSVQIISEKGRETRTLVPCPWVDSINEIVYWPPKGKPLGVYLANWTEPGKDWKSYEIIKTILESGTKDEADQMMNMPTTTEDSETENETGEYISSIFSCKSLENIKNVTKKESNRS